MENLSVVELKDELRKRNLDTTGTRAALLERLRKAVGEEFVFSEQERDVEHSVVPGDSVSQVSRRSHGSRHSTASSRSSVRVTRAMEAARKAGLAAKASSLRLMQEKEEEELRIRREKEEEELRIRKEKEENELRIRHDKEKLQVQAELDEATARERVLMEFESQDNASNTSSKDSTLSEGHSRRNEY